jgi:hypothetical protein
MLPTPTFDPTPASHNHRETSPTCLPKHDPFRQNVRPTRLPKPAAARPVAV